MICRDLEVQLKDDPQFLTKVVTGDEIWCYGHDLESKAAVNSVEVTKFAQTKRRAASSLQCQDNFDFFSFLFMPMG